MIRAALTAAFVALAAVPAQAEIDIVPVTSPGGIHAWLVQDTSIPFVSLEMRFRGGASLDPVGKEGAAYLATGLLEEGAADMDAQAFATRTEELAASFEFDVYTDTASVSARFLTENRDAAIAHLRAALIEPRFDDVAIERVRNQILSILSSNAKDPQDIANATLDTQVFPDHPYGQQREGTPETVAALTRDDLIAAHQRLMTRDNVYVGAAGDISPEELGVLLDTLLGDLPASGVPLPPVIAPVLSGDITVVDWDTPQSVVMFAQPGLQQSDPDFIPAYILNQILGGSGFSTRLMSEVREKRGLTYGIGSFMAVYDRSELLMGQFSSDNGKVAEAIGLVKDIWADVAANGVTQAELDEAKTYLTGAYPLRFDGNGPIANILVGMQISGLGLDYIPQRNDLVNAVTLDEINRVAKSLLQPDKLTFVVVGQPAGLPGTN